MKLDFLYVNVICDYQTVDLFLIIGSGFQVEPDAEHAG